MKDILLSCEDISLSLNGISIIENINLSLNRTVVFRQKGGLGGTVIRYYILCGIQLLVFVKVLPAGGGTQPLGVEEAPQEEGPGGQKSVPMLGEEHLFKVDAVSLPGGGVGAVGQDIGRPADVGGGNGDNIQEFLVESQLPKERSWRREAVEKSPGMRFRGSVSPAKKTGAGRARP